MTTEGTHMVQEQPTPLETQLAEFAAQHPELAEAMRVFGLSSAQYARAIAALTHCPTLTSTSTDLVAPDH